VRKVFNILLSLVILGTLFYQFRDFVFSPIPCAEPIPYNLGTFNTEFNISQKYFLSALSDAEAIWEKPFGKDLFTYLPEYSKSDILKINLIYDYRQQATSKLASLGIYVNDTRASYDTLKAKFTTLQAEYNTQKNIFDTRVADFNQKQKNYQAEVISWNKKGGAPQKEYDRLQITQSALEAESKELQTMQTKLNDMVDEINALVVVLNRLVGTLNLSVEKYNTVNTSRGESFEEGVYISDGSNRQIDIYEFSSRAKLVRVLAHELGHALNLDHVADPKAIMYELNQGENMTLTKADLAELNLKCATEQ